MNQSPIVSALIAHVIAECKAIDCEQAFRDMLDETCPVVEIGSLSYNPSRVLEEVDPIAFRCGVSDMFANGEHYEIEGETYSKDYVEAAKESFLDTLTDDDERAEIEAYTF